MAWEDVRKEMVEEKGVAADVADRIGMYVTQQGKMELVEQLSADPELTAVKDAQDGLNDMKLMLRYCQLFGVLDKASSGQTENDSMLTFYGICRLPLM